MQLYESLVFVDCKVCGHCLSSATGNILGCVAWVLLLGRSRHVGIRFVPAVKIAGCPQTDSRCRLRIRWELQQPLPPKLRLEYVSEALHSSLDLDVVLPFSLEFFSKDFSWDSLE